MALAPGGYKDAWLPLYRFFLQLYRSTFFRDFALDIPFLLIVHSFLLRLCRPFFHSFQATVLRWPEPVATPHSCIFNSNTTHIFNMLSSSLVALLLSAGLTEAGFIPAARQPLSHLRLRATANSSGLTLLSTAIQKGSFNDGSDEIGAKEVGQALSATSQNNFINNCAGKTLTNGLQITTGSCNGISTSATPSYRQY
jgi:hypothetical protein